MSIPLTASTEAFTPECMAEIEEAPSFTFRHATVLDKHEFHSIAIAEGLMQHTDSDLRETIIGELRRMFESDGLERNITQLEAYWQSNDELRSAQEQHRQQVMEILSAAEEGTEPELPPAPVLDFPEDRIADLEAMVAEVRRHSPKVNGMLADNHRFQTFYPRILLRMFLTGTTLPVKLQRRGKLITAESCEELLEALGEAAKRANDFDDGPDDPEAGEDRAGAAISQLLVKALLAFALRKDEEKNSSSPRSDITSPAQSPNKQSTGPQTTPSTKSSDPVTSGEDSGSASSD
jgi:hypothetical protein